MLLGCATSGGKTIFDGVCDPVVAAVFDRMKVGKLGKVRKFLLIGYGVTILSAILMFNILANRFTGSVGVLMFCLHFALYIIGYLEW